MDLTQPGTPIDLEKMRSISVLGKRTRPTVAETRQEDGTRTKAVTDELNNTVTEHSRPGTGVSFRQDVNVRPKVVEFS